MNICRFLPFLALPSLVSAQSVDTATIRKQLSRIDSATAVIRGTLAVPPPVVTPPKDTTPVPPKDTTTPPVIVVPPGSGNPIPAPGDVTLVDTRLSMQSATSLATALPGKPLGSATLGSTVMTEVMSGNKFVFVPNLDGAGTHGLRVDWAKYSGTCADQAATLVVYLAKPYPKHLYVSYKQRLGRSETGGGVGAVNSFQITNSACGNASRKAFLVLRDRADLGGQGRIDYIWPGPAPVRPAITADVANAATTRYDATTAWNPQQHVGDVITTTIEYQAASSSTAKDGILRVWINGVNQINVTTAPISSEAFERFQFPATFNSPSQDQSEYFWDLVAWRPTP